MANVNIDPKILTPAQISQILSQRGYSAARTSGMSPEQLLSELSSSGNDAFKARYGSTFTRPSSTGTSTAGTAPAASSPKMKLFSDNLGNKFKSGLGSLMSPEFDYTLKSGVQGWGQNLGGYATTINGVMQGINAAQGLGNLSDAKTETDDLSSDIVTSAMNNPMVNYDLTAEQQQLLSQLRRGTYDADVGLDDVNLLGALGDVGMGVLTGAAGGVPGMIVGGLGGLINSGIGDLTNAQSRKNAELQALYAALQESNQNYGNMRKQRMLASF